MHRIFNSIRVRITITLFLVVFAGVVSFEYFEYENEKSQAITQQQDLATKKSHRLTESLTLPLWELDKSWVKRVIDNEITDQSVYAIMVNSEGSFFEGSKRDENWQPVRSGNNITGDYITVTQQIRHEGEAIGSVTIYLTMRFILKALQEKAIYELLMALLLGTVGLTLLLLMLNRMVIAPIEQMLKSTLAIAAGDYSHDVNAQQADEIGQLARSINVMKKNIQAREEERDGALNSLQESESRFRQLAMQISVPLASVSSDGNMEFLNDRFVQTFGYSLKDVPTIEAWWPLAYPDKEYRAWVQQTWERACQLAVAENRDIEPIEYNVTCKSGDVCVVEISGVFLGDEMLVTLLDLTARKRAEAKMRRYAQALEQSGEAIVITDVDGAIEHINAAYSEITGYSAKEAVGKNPRMLKSGSQNARFYEKMWHTLLKGEVWQGKVINRRKSGDHYPAMLTISPIRDDAGKTVNYIGVQQNLEKFEELEAQFHQSQKMEAIGTLVGGIAHDFNNNLAGITGNLYLAKKAAKKLPDVVKRLESVEKLSFSAAATIQQLLTFSRKGIVQMNPISITSFLKESIKLNQISLPESIDLQLQVIDADLHVNGDINQLQQLLLNLINNACDAVEGRDSPTIQIRLEHFEADNAFMEQHENITESKFACISVIDNGAGIAADDLEHIFEPFFTTKSVGRGTGLGLAMVYGSVKTHGGAVNVQSTPGSGTRVDVYLPLLESDDAVALTELNDEVIHGNGETILLVDDNETVLNTGSDVLTGMGYKVMTAVDGRDAVEVYNAHGQEIDMVILDVVMPRLSGPEALAAIKEVNPDVKVIFATGYDKLSTLGMDKSKIDEKIISKPFAVSLLSQMIREVLER